MKKNYDHLANLSRKTKLLASVSHLLGWDQETYMPKGASAFRAEQQEYLAALIHKESLSPEFEKTLFSLIDKESGEVLHTNFEQRQKAALREWRRDFLIAKKLPDAFVSEHAHAKAISADAWTKAKQENNFELFAPHLEKMFDFAKRKSDYLGYETHPYNALLDLYEPGLTLEELTPIFDHLSPKLTALIKQAKKPADDTFLYGNFPIDKQEVFTKELLETMGIDPSRSRLDRSSHPFCMELHPSDVRLTTHLESSSIMNNISAVLHEGGHALYELGLPERFYGTPLGESVSLGIHESQSRFWETIIGQSLPFWKYFYPKLQTLFPKQFDSVSLHQFHSAINRVEPSLIRIHSDEVGYSLHVILRFEIERDLLAGTLKVRDVPDAWHEKMHRLLGVTPKTHSEGCLQDIHWASGLIGYFPTYAIGNIVAAQIFASFRGDFLDWEERVSQGHFIFIKEWLHESVHKHGREYTPKKLVARITNKELGYEDYIQYLETKYQQKRG